MFLGEKREKKTRKKCTWVKKKGGCRTVFVGFRSVWGAENTYFSTGACGGLLDEELNSRSSVGEGVIHRMQSSSISWQKLIHLVCLKSTSGKLVLGPLPARNPPCFQDPFYFDSPDSDSGTFWGAFGGQIPISKGKSSVWDAPQTRKIRFGNLLNCDF